MEQMKRMHVYISGRVQGVFFRAYTQATAQSLSLTGWVRNLSDGRVEAVFEGKDENIAAMLEWCGKGPPYAVVRDVDVFEEPPTGEFPDFRITRP
jgi:acylphosphatase